MKDGALRHVQFAAALVAACVLLILLVGKPIPVVIWDEGRIVVSAMEMRHTGLGLVTTYDFRPDLWNTKPPLLIWLMTISMALFGPSEFALRLPSLLSSLGTMLLVMVFLRRITGSAAIAAFGGMALVASVGFFGEHGARTADYDALLCFFTTGYAMLLFFALHRSRPPRHWLILAGLAAAGALMTKGIAGGIPATGVLLYACVMHRWRRLLLTPRYYAAGLLAAAPIALFLILRENAAGGYVHAMIFNDGSSTFNAAHDNHFGSYTYYLDQTFFSGLFSLGPLTLLAPLALPLARGKVRLALIFALCIALGQWIVVTMSSTKLVHYYLSAYPFVAIASALAVHGSLLRLRAFARRRAMSPITIGIARFAPALLLASGVAQAIDAQVTVLAPRETYPRARYGALLETLASERAPILLIDSGWNTTTDPHYAPELRFYLMRAREHGRHVYQAGEVDRIATTPSNTIVASCDPAIVRRLTGHPGEILRTPVGCVARK